MKKITWIVLGAIMIAAGVIYILDIFGITNANLSFDGWWAFFIIIPCLGGLFTSKDKIGNLFGLLVGVLLLLAAQEVLSYGTAWKLVVPIIIVLLGIKMICRATAPKSNKVNVKDSPDKEYMSAFKSQEFDFDGEEIKLAKLGAVFGGTKCNLTNAVIKDGSQIDVFCAFGGADIIVPENVNIKINAFCLFGGIADKRAKNETNENAPTLLINGFCLFGGADIK